MLAPALAVMRRIQQPVHQRFVRRVAPVGNKIIHFLRSRRQTNQIQAKPPDQRCPTRFRRRLQPFAFQPRQHESINCVPRPLRVLRDRLRRPHRRFKSPMLLLFGGHQSDRGKHDEQANAAARFHPDGPRHNLTTNLPQISPPIQPPVAVFEPRIDTNGR